MTTTVLQGRDLRKMLDEKRKKWAPQCAQARAENRKDPATVWVCQHIQEAIETGGLTVNDWSVREMGESLIQDGVEYWRMMDPRRNRGGFQITEAIDAVSTDDMKNIIGQLVFSAINEALTLDQTIADQLSTNFPSQFLGEEKVPGISNASDEFEADIPEGDPYPKIGLSEEWVTLPAAAKKGGILPLTREAIIADRTGLLVERAQGVGNGLAIRKEKSIIDVSIGAVNPYTRNGEARLTYGDGATAGQAMGFINEGTNAFVNYTDIIVAEALFRRMRDPNTNEPLSSGPTTIWSAFALKYQVRNAIRAVQINQTEALVRAAGVVEIGQKNTGNLIPYDLTPLSNEWLRDRLIAGIAAAAGGLAGLDEDLIWFFGNPKKAFVWKEIWPLTVEPAPSNNEVMFTQDVWMRFKVGYMGTAGVREPRYVVRIDGSA